jgi:hypothetical protein
MKWLVILSDLQEFEACKEKSAKKLRDFKVFHMKRNKLLDAFEN